MKWEKGMKGCEARREDFELLRGCPARHSHEPIGFVLVMVLLATAASGWARTKKQRDSVTDAQARLQLMQPGLATAAGPPLTLTLADAMQRAQQNSPAFQSALTAERFAHEGRKQATASMLPSFGDTTQYLNTQGNGLGTGRYVENDGVHVYHEWLVAGEPLPSTFFIRAAPRQARYAEALAKAEAKIARRGLVVTVTRDYYALVVAQREYATAQRSAADARRFLGVARALESGGEVAHTDVIRFELQYNQQTEALQNAQLAMDNARLALAVLLFPTLNENFAVVDDLDTPPALPPFHEVRTLAATANPQIRAVFAQLDQAELGVSVARAAYFPSFGIDLDYGLDANAFALESRPTEQVARVPELGYFVTYSMNVPIWDWGIRRSQLRQAEDRRNLARLDLTYAQRKVLSELYSFYNEAQVAWNQLDTLRNSSQLAARNLQLVTMQYKAGEATVLEVLDAENSLAATQNAYAAGQALYRGDLANLQTLTGRF
jgi:outer membrane protein